MLGAYAQVGTDVSRYTPIILMLVFVIVVYYILKNLGGGHSYYGSKGLSWKIYCFFIGIGLIAGASIISNFMNQPTMTTPLLAIGVLLVIVALVGSLAGLGGST